MKILESHTVPAISEKIRLQEYAVSIFTSVKTRSGIKKTIKKELLLIDGKIANTGDWIQEGQKLELLKNTSEKKKIFKLDFEVLFEDQYIGIIHKPPGFPTSGNYFKTIENALPHNLKKSGELDALPFPLPAHRLDNPTSGILLCAKTRNSLVYLQEGFAEKAIKKTYFAVVRGEIKESFEIDSKIETKQAITQINPIKNYKIDGENYTLVKLNPLTGRTHQLRIHLSENNYPIVGDPIYGITEKGYFKGKSLYLFAGGILFQHPVTKKQLKIELQLPKKFRNLDYYRAH